MNTKIKSEFQILFVVVFAAITLAAISAFVGGTIQPQRVSAQAIPTATPKSITITDETLQAFGLPLNPIQTAANDDRFNLQVVKNADVLTVTSGSLITFTISITNHGPDPASGVFFQDLFPTEMKDIDYDFSSGAGAIDNGALNPEDKIWLLTNSIPVNGMVAITVTGQLTSARDITVTNTAMITTYNPSSETNPSDNSSSAEVGIAGWNPSAAGLIYLPIVSRFPTPTPLPIALAYSENFSSSDAWFEFNSNGCKTENKDGRYQVRLEDGSKDCLPPARNENNPEKPYRTYGEFQVSVYHSENQSNAALGIFINGEGGDNYYLFRIWPNNGCSSGGDWQLQRRKDGNTSTIKSKSCDTAVNRGGSTNVLRIAHKPNQLILYINGIQVEDIISEDSTNERKGTGTGVFVSSTSKDIVIKFDDFRVYKYQ